jgi:hypothetical protein
MNNKINGFDNDGVISIGIFPGPNDVIITGRSYEEEKETIEFMHNRNIFNKIYFNPVKFNEKTRKSSGEHKVNTINELKKEGIKINIFFEDDPIQKEVIEYWCPWIKVVHIVHNLTEKENIKRDSNGNEIKG